MIPSAQMQTVGTRHWALTRMGF